MKKEKILAMSMTFMIVLGSMAIVAGIATDNDIFEKTSPTENLLGEGTPGNPFMIHNVTELQAMNDNVTAHYALANDIDASETSGWNGGEGFVPVGDDTTPFTGSFDGRNNMIYGFVINRSQQQYIGLFGQANGGVSISNTILWDATILGNQRTGGFVGNNLGTVENCDFYGTVYAPGVVYVGGIVGRNVAGTISHCTSTGYIRGTNVGGITGDNLAIVRDCHSSMTVRGSGLIGGLVGFNSNNGNIINSSAEGHVDGFAAIRHAGGLVGYNLGGTITDSYATGDVNGGYNIGGLVGYNPGGTVERSYAKGNATGRERVGGFVGNNSGGTVSNSYSRGHVIQVSGYSTPDIGGFVGDNTEGTVINSYSTGSVIFQDEDDPMDKGFCGYLDESLPYTMLGNFWDVETSGQTSTAGNATGENTAEMKTLSTFTDTGWDFADIWWMVEGVTYPLLSWHPVYNVHTERSFELIQNAVNALDTLDGHTICAAPGIFRENILVLKSLDIIGAGSEQTYIDASGRDFGVFIMANHTSFRGFTVMNATNDDPGAGIIIANPTGEGNGGPPPTVPIVNCIIDDIVSTGNNMGLLSLDMHESTITDGSFIDNVENGILSFSSNNNTLANNIASHNGEMGIGMIGSHYNDLFHNNASSNTGWGIIFLESHNNDIYHNSASSNGFVGIGLMESEQNTLYDNTVSFNTGGILLIGSNYTEINGNDAISNTLGIGLVESCHYNVVSENIVSSNTNAGIGLDDSMENTIRDNLISHNEDGIRSEDSHDNHIYHNIFMNNGNHSWDNGTNSWDDGYPSGGNYWDDHTEPDEYSGPGQDIPGSDGIVDVRRDIEGNGNADYYPWTNPHFELLIEISSPTPADGAEDVALDATLSVYIGADGHPTDVEFYVDGLMIHSETVDTDGTVTAVPDLEYDAVYMWYVIASNDGGANQTVSPTFTFTTESQSANTFNVFVDDIMAGEPLVIEIFDGEDEYGNPLEGEFTVVIEINGDEETVDILFDTGEAEYTWPRDLTTVGEYAAEVTIDSTTESDSFSVGPAEVVEVVLEPSDDQTITSGGTVEFSAVAYDEYDNVITDTESDFNWVNTTAVNSGLFDEMVAGIYHVTASYGEVTSDVVIVTVEEDIPTTYQLTVTIDGEGTVAREPQQDEYEDGTTVTLSATPAEGWEFVEWTGDVTGTDRNITVTMDENKSVTAVFHEIEEVVTYELTVNILGQGTVSRDPNQEEYAVGTTVTLTASPSDGWEFVEWTGDATGTGTDITVTMDENKSVTAVFREIEEDDPTSELLSDYLWLILLIIIVVIVLLLILLKKKGGSQVPEEESSEEEPSEEESSEEEPSEEEPSEEEPSEIKTEVPTLKAGSTIAGYFDTTKQLQHCILQRCR